MLQKFLTFFADYYLFKLQIRSAWSKQFYVCTTDISIAPSLARLKEDFTMCEWQIFLSDVCINVMKSTCFCAGHRCDTLHCIIFTFTGNNIPKAGAKTMKNLGICVVSWEVFKWLFDEAQHAVHGSLDTIYGKDGEIASEVYTYVTIVAS